MSTDRTKCWEELIVNFFEKVRNIKTGTPCKLFKARECIKNKEAKIKKEKNNNKLKRLKKSRDKKKEALKKLRSIAPITEIPEWISSASKRKIRKGQRIIEATHVLKFSHSYSENAGILSIVKSDDLLLTTSSVKKSLTLDLAHNNANLITISRFLNLQLNGKRIFDCIKNDDFSFLDLLQISWCKMQVYAKNIFIITDR